jgi:N-acetylmuramoyl-L-alanine amidase
VTRLTRGVALLALLLLGGASAAPAAAGADQTVLRDIRRTILGDTVRVVIQLDAEVAYRSQRLDAPARVLFDLPATRLGPAVGEGTISYSGEMLRHIRVGRHPNSVIRVVLDLEGVRRCSMFTLYNPYRIVVDCERDRTPVVPLASERIAEERLALPPPEPEPPPPVLEGRAVRIAPRTLDPAAGPAPTPVLLVPLSPPATLRVTRTFRPQAPLVAWLPTVSAIPASVLFPSPAAARTTPVDAVAKAADKMAPTVPAAETRADPEEKPSTPAEKPAGTTRAADRPITPAAPLAMPPNGFSLARQLGLGASRIVVDPGHGGHDPGAGGQGVFEATVVLDVALRLEKLLKAAGCEVVLTRRTNEYVQLEERTAIANRALGDLFLSIHANASRNRTARGIETYVLNFASNPDAEAVAARENAATGRTMSSLTDIVRAITLNNKLDESKNFASLVQREMVAHLKASNRGLKDHGVKQAPFVVLIGASMPSVLVEVSFITHSQEGRLLKGTAYRQRIAEALFDAVRGYQKSLKGSTALTNQ